MRHIAGSRWARMAVCLLCAAAAACGRSEEVSSPSTKTTADAPSHRYSMELSATHLQPGASFTVTFASDPPGGAIHLSPVLGLMQGERRLNFLLVRREGDPDSSSGVQPPDFQVPAFALSGAGPHRFELPSTLAPGAYQVCTGVSGEEGPRTAQPVCADFAI